jgi:hypothetical protein
VTGIWNSIELIPLAIKCIQVYTPMPARFSFPPELIAFRYVTAISLTSGHLLLTCSDYTAFRGHKDNQETIFVNKLLLTCQGSLKSLKIRPVRPAPGNRTTLADILNLHAIPHSSTIVPVKSLYKGLAPAGRVSTFMISKLDPGSRNVTRLPIWELYLPK